MREHLSLITTFINCYKQTQMRGIPEQHVPQSRKNDLHCTSIAPPLHVQKETNNLSNDVALLLVKRCSKRFIQGINNNNYGFKSLLQFCSND